MGAYILVAVLADTFANNTTCSTQFEWTSSKICEIIGIIGSFGSIVSLNAMTVISIIRAKGLLASSLKQPSPTLSKSCKVSLTLSVLGIMFVALTFSLLPLTVYEDYFVTERVYSGNSLFTGAPDKKKLLKILAEYYGHLKKSLKWSEIRKLIAGMFKNDNSPMTTGKKISFYGSDGFCLFKYFTRSTDK